MTDESESRYRQIVESLPQLVWTCDAQGAANYTSKQLLAFVGRSAADVTARLKARGVLVAPVRAAGAAVDDPQAAAIGLLDELDGVKLTRTPLAQFNPHGLSPAQHLGEDSADVLAERLGLGPDELRELAAAGVVETAGEPESQTVAGT